MIPVLISKMNSLIFIISGILSLSTTLGLIYCIYHTDRVQKPKDSKVKLLGVVILVYSVITAFYFLKLIPPVPLALDQSLLAYNISKENDTYEITYDADDWYIFWRDHKPYVNINSTDKIYIFTSIFAPTDLNKKVYHLWKRYNPKTDTWDVTDKIGFTVVGGRNRGFRGFSYKNNIAEGEWKVEVVTEEGLIIGVLDFRLISKTKGNSHIKTISL